MEGIGSGGGKKIGTDNIDLTGYLPIDGSVAMTGDLDMGNNDIRMGTGLIGFDGTAGEGLSFDTTGNVTFETTAGSLILPQNNDATTPTLAFGDGNSGFYESADNTIYVSIAGGNKFYWTGNFFRTSNGGGGAMLNGAASSTTPVFLPKQDDADTGIGWAGADTLSGIVGGIEAVRFVEDTTCSMHLAETATPTAISGYGSFYPKTNNKAYFQDGGGNEHEISLVGHTIGEMFMYEATQTVTINTTNVYHGIFGFSTGDVENWTFADGGLIDANIANEIDATDLQIETSGAHGLVTGDVVTHSDMNNAGHNGATAITYVDATNYTCDDILYVAGAGASAGIVNQPATLTAGTGAAGKYKISFSLSGDPDGVGKTFKWEMNQNGSMIDTVVAERKHANADIGSLGSGGFATIADGDKVWLSVKNITDDTNFVIEHGNVNLFKL